MYISSKYEGQRAPPATSLALFTSRRPDLGPRGVGLSRSLLSPGEDVFVYSKQSSKLNSLYLDSQAALSKLLAAQNFEVSIQ